MAQTATGIQHQHSPNKVMLLGPHPTSTSTAIGLSGCLSSPFLEMLLVDSSSLFFLEKPSTGRTAKANKRLSSSIVMFAANGSTGLYILCFRIICPTEQIRRSSFDTSGAFYALLRDAGKGCLMQEFIAHLQDVLFIRAVLR